MTITSQEVPDIASCDPEKASGCSESLSCHLANEKRGVAKTNPRQTHYHPKPPSTPDR
jgi:hypothetical protein